MDNTVKVFKKEKKAAAKGGNVKIKSSEEVKGWAVKSNKCRGQDGNNDVFKQKTSSSCPLLKKGYKRPLISGPKSSQPTEKQRHFKPTEDNLSKLSPITKPRISVNAPENVERVKRKRLDAWCTKSANRKG